MHIEIEAYTNIAEVYVDVFEFQTPEGELLAIDSDSTYYDRDEKYCRININMEGVYRFDETEHYLNGKGEMLSKLKIANCRLYFEERPKDAPWFFIKSISIHDGELHYTVPKEKFAEIDIADDHEQKVDIKPPLNKIEAMIELHTFISGKNDSKWSTRVRGFESLENAKNSIIVYLYHLINKNKIKDKLMKLKTTYSAYNAISQEVEYVDSDECRVLFENGMFSFYGDDMEFPTCIQVSLDNTVNMRKDATLLIRDEETEKFLYSELCGSATAIRELECVDGKTVDSSWIESVDRRTNMTIIKQRGEFLYEEKIYRIGDRVIATDESEYEGLYGVITQICDGDDKDTDNDTPDIYCSFEKPENKDKVAEIEQRFSKAYGEEKKIDDLALDLVIMAPSMIRVLECKEK